MKPTIFIPVIAGLSLGLTTHNIYTPVCKIPGELEAPLVLASFMFPLLSIVPIYYGVRKGLKISKKYLLFFFVTAITIPSFISGGYRHVQMMPYRWAFDGEVTKKYISSNREAKVIIVDGTVYENVPLKAWEVMNVGDNVKKIYCERIYTINGIEYKI